MIWSMGDLATGSGTGAIKGDAAGPLERTFLIGDVRGYTSFTRERGDAEAARLAKRFAEVARDAVAARSGRVTELRGDEVLAVFTSPDQAVRAAVELQAVCEEEVAADPTLPLLVGVGIDVGKAVPVEDGFRGAALNTAARLCSQAAAGQVLVTSQVAERVGAIPGVSFTSAGSSELKGFETPVELIEVVADEPPSVADLPTDALPLPIELELDTPLVDREHELAWLRGTWRQVRRGYGRIVFVSGPAKTGKSRLTAEVAGFAHSSGAAVSYAGAGGTAAALAQSAVRAAIADRQPSLVVLDDFDVVGEAVAPTLAALMDAIEAAPTLIVVLVRDPEASRAVARLIDRADGRGDGHRRLGPLDAVGVREIACLYAGADVQEVPLESIERASSGVPGRVHEVMSDWAEREATRRLAAAAEFLATERRERSADLEFANNVIGLKLARLYGGEEGPFEPGAGECPYKGLASFEEKDARLFFGRERLVGELAARTVGAGLLAVVGASGSGKSSVIGAGLLPSLGAGLLPGSERWRSLVMRPGEHPLATLDSLSIADEDGGERLVLVIDQFEELFTTCQDEEESSRFVEQLVAIARDADRAVVVLGLRADFAGECAAYPELAELLAANLVLVGPMSSEELRRAIELPARRAGLRVESSLAEALVAEIGDEPGGLPLLSTALVELWMARSDGWLKLEAHETLGGVRGAVARLADSSYDNLTDEERSAARRLFMRLVSTGEEGALARRTVPLSELDLEREPVLASVVARLTDDRLLTAHDSAVEVAHEALLREWPRFQEWLTEDAQGRELREHLTQSAKRWEGADRDDAELYRGARLSATFEWAAGRQQELNELEREFLAESRAESERELARQRRTNRRLKSLLVGVGVLLLAAIAAGAFALVQRSDAQDKARIALGRQLGAVAVSEPRIDLSMLLARESLALDRSLQTESTLLATLLREPAVTGTFTVPIEDRPQQVRVSPDGRMIAVSSNNNVMRFFDTRTHRHIRTEPLVNADYAFVTSTGRLFAAAPGDPPAYTLLDPRTGDAFGEFILSKLWQTTPSTPFEPVLVTQDGRRAFLVWAVWNEDGSQGAAYVETWRLEHPGPPRLVPLHAKGIIAATLTPDGRLVVATNGAISTWNAETMRRISEVPGPRLKPEFVSGALSPDGRTLAYGLGDGTVHFFHVGTGKEVAGTGAHSAGVARMAFSPDSRTVVSAGDDALAILWNPATGVPLERLTGHAGRILWPDFSADGKTLYTPSLDGTILQYDLGGSRRFGSPFKLGVAGLRAQTLDAAPLLAVSPDGRSFATTVEQSKVNLFSTSTLRRVATISLASRRTVGAGAWAGSRFVLGGDRGLVQIWNVAGAKPKPVAVLHGLSNQGQVRSIATAARDRVVAAVDSWDGPDPGTGGPPPREGELAIWRDGRLVGGKAMNLHTYGNAVAVSRDGSTVAVATEDGRVLVVDAHTGRAERTIRPQRAPVSVTSIAFSPDGTLASGSWAGILNLWNPRTGQGLGHPTLVAQAPVSAIAFAPDGKMFATSGGSSGHTKAWVTSTLQQLGDDFPGGEGSWGNVAYAPNGRYLFSAYADGSAYRWPVTVGAWADQACRVAGRNFTREEWQRFVAGRSYERVCPTVPAQR
jgi:WD40 repeat protein/class 3 adenylate cyclase/predicted ABC-type transport system involved in lysophospholipase L1 biosynthesis ATPase subunit